jgi:hypothetical protein
MVNENDGTAREHPLRDARKRRLKWTDIADLVTKNIGPEARLDGERRVIWLEEAAEESGYTAAVLRRFANTLAFARDFFEPPIEERILEDSFTALEMIHRIARHDPEEAVRLSAELGKASMPVSKLRKALKDSSAKRLARRTTPWEETPPPPPPEGRLDPRPTTASVRNWRADVALSELHALLPRLTGKFARFERPGGTAPPSVRCDAIAWVDGWMTGDGFEIVHAPSAAAKSLLSDRVARAVVSARFFRKFFLVFTSDSSETHVARAQLALDQLDVKSVGVVHLGALRPLVRKRSGPTAPDWSHMLSIVCPEGQWDEEFSLPASRT